MEKDSIKREVINIIDNNLYQSGYFGLPDSKRKEIYKNIYDKIADQKKKKEWKRVLQDLTKKPERVMALVPSPKIHNYLSQYYSKAKFEYSSD